MQPTWIPTSPVLATTQSRNNTGWGFSSPVTTLHWAKRVQLAGAKAAGIEDEKRWRNWR